MAAKTLVSEDQLEAIELIIRGGDIPHAARELRDLPLKDLDASVRFRVANLLRRAGMATDSLKVLAKVVRPTDTKKSTATAAERAEYAASLVSVGAWREALDLLNGVSIKEYPQASFYRALAFVGHWDYPESIPELNAFLKSNPPQYLQTVGLLNLAAAQVFVGQSKEARESLARVEAVAKSAGNSLVLVNCHELRAQSHISEKDFGAAWADLEKADLLLKDSTSLAALLVRKWRAVISYKKSAETSVKELLEVQAEASRIRNFETVRDCDYQIAVLTGDIALEKKLYFGTPYPRYRERLLKRLGHDGARLPDWVNAPFERTLRADGGVADRRRTRERLADLERIEFGAIQATGFKRDNLLHRLLESLDSDFYRPSRVATLFSELFGDLYFNPISSPRVVHQLVVRLRKILDSSDIPLEIFNEEGFYELKARRDCLIIISPTPGKPRLDDRLEQQWSLIKEKFQGQDFSAAELADLIEATPRTARRSVEAFVKDARLEIVGRGRSQKYRLSRL